MQFPPIAGATKPKATNYVSSPTATKPKPPIISLRKNSYSTAAPLPLPKIAYSEGVSPHSSSPTKYPNISEICQPTVINNSGYRCEISLCCNDAVQTCSARYLTGDLGC